jgi:hypothetical protein
MLSMAAKWQPFVQLTLQSPGVLASKNSRESPVLVLPIEPDRTTAPVPNGLKS